MAAPPAAEATAEITDAPMLNEEDLRKKLKDGTLEDKDLTEEVVLCIMSMKYGNIDAALLRRGKTVRDLREERGVLSEYTGRNGDTETLWRIPRSKARGRQLPTSRHVDKSG
eukprot:9223429-Pyramimonas_sp.AAC.1